MKVIFLDFDGVLNSQGSFLYEDNRRNKHKEQGVKGSVSETLCNVCTANFQNVLDVYPQVKVVLSTTWRELYEMDWLKQKLESYHIDSTRVIGRTPSRRDGDRGREIQQWLDENKNVTQYIVIDDNDWGISAIHGERFIHTTWAGGFTYDHRTEAIKKLANSFKEWLENKTVKERKIK